MLFLCRKGGSHLLTPHLCLLTAWDAPPQSNETSEPRQGYFCPGFAWGMYFKSLSSLPGWVRLGALVPALSCWDPAVTPSAVQQLGNGEMCGGVQTLQAIMGQRPGPFSSSLPKPHHQHRIIPPPSLPTKAEPNFSPGSSSGPLLPSKLGNISSPASFPLATSLLQGNIRGGFQYLLHGDRQAQVRGTLHRTPFPPKPSKHSGRRAQGSPHCPPRAQPPCPWHSPAPSTSF